MAKGEVYEFAGFRLDASQRLLSRDGHALALAPKSYDLLLALVRSAGKLVTKRELLDLVWRGTFVEEGILAVHVSTLRKALGGDDGERRFIETVPRIGYRFVAEVRLLAEELPARPAAHPRAYELFGRGRYLLLSYSMFHAPKAVEAFRAAIDLDPAYAPAHAGLALACCALAAMRLAPPAQAYHDARVAALHALAMDSTCVDAQAALGAVLFFSEWNWPGAERSLKRALRLNPNHSEALLAYGQLLEALGRLEEGLQMKLRALERDPFSPLVHLQISLSYWNQRRYDDAIAWANRTLDLDPRHPHAREHLAAAYWKKGDPDRYMAENLKHAELHGAPPEAVEHLRQTYAAGGRTAVLQLVVQRASTQAFPAMQLALFHGELGNLDSAFESLWQAIESHDPGLVHLAVAPQWDCLRSDPRFADALSRMGLSAAQTAATATHYDSRS